MQTDTKPRRWLRYPDLVARGIVNNRTTLARRIEKDGFPKSTSLGLNSIAWLESEVEAWEEARIQASREAA